MHRGDDRRTRFLMAKRRIGPPPAGVFEAPKFLFPGVVDGPKVSGIQVAEPRGSQGILIGEERPRCLKWNVKVASAPDRRRRSLLTHRNQKYARAGPAMICLRRFRARCLPTQARHPVADHRKSLSYLLFPKVFSQIPECSALLDKLSVRVDLASKPCVQNCL